ncbi:ABC transporter ATP-binding protein [Gammaproteobacteria bacterium]|nr:ABC transporter ATP-binding protein [Gammaproteobacteria bacterium]
MNAPQTNALVSLRRLTFGYGERLIFNDLTMDIPRGKVTIVMGPSGCGKSTTLGFMGGRLKPQSGEVIFDGQRVDTLKRADLYHLRRRMGMMFQHNALLTDLTVFDNVAFPLRENTRLDETLIRRVVLLKLEMVGLRGARDLYPSELSGGMARRISLARAIAMDPDLVMYDEPFTGLDPISMGITVNLIRELNDALNLTSVVVTHDIAEGMSIADHMVLLSDGGVLASGSPEALKASTDAKVRQFMDGKPDGPVRFHYPADDYLNDIRGGRS